jgi:hypothetical protein
MLPCAQADRPTAQVDRQGADVNCELKVKMDVRQSYQVCNQQSAWQDLPGHASVYTSLYHDIYLQRILHVLSRYIPKNTAPLR